MFTPDRCRICRLVFAVLQDVLEVWREANPARFAILSRRNIQNKRQVHHGRPVGFWSLDNPDVTRGRKCRRIIVVKGGNGFRRSWML